MMVCIGMDEERGRACIVMEEERWLGMHRDVVRASPRGVGESSRKQIKKENLLSSAWWLSANETPYNLITLHYNS